MITISKPIVKDVLDIQGVFYHTWLETYPNAEVGITRADIEEHFKDWFSPEVIEQRKKALELLPENNLYMIAKDNEKVVGVCRFIRKEHCNQLQAIYVLPEYQGKGIGNMFWEKCVEFIDSSKETIVQVATYNKNAIAFYEKLGFVDTGKRFTEERHRMPLSGVLIPEMEMVLNSEKAK